MISDLKKATTACSSTRLRWRPSAMRDHPPARRWIHLRDLLQQGSAQGPQLPPSRLLEANVPNFGAVLNGLNLAG